MFSGSSFSGATDIYSMGVMFYEMVTGESPFIGETTIDIMKQINDKPPIEPIKLRFDIPMEINDMILHMMGKDKIIVVTLSGRGDKDAEVVAKHLGVKI